MGPLWVRHSLMLLRTIQALRLFSGCGCHSRRGRSVTEGHFHTQQFGECLLGNGDQYIDCKEGYANDNLEHPCGGLDRYCFGWCAVKCHRERGGHLCLLPSAGYNHQSCGSQYAVRHFYTLGHC
jgi:hypothetical protein